MNQFFVENFIENSSTSTAHIRKLQLTDLVEAMFIVSHDQVHVREMISSLMLDAFVGFQPGKPSERELQLSSLLQSINTELSNLSTQKDVQGLSIYVAIREQNQINFSLFGQSIYGIFFSKEGVMDIFEDMRSDEIGFAFDSNGMVGNEEALYISNQPLENILADTDFEDLNSIDDIDTKKSLVQGLCKRANTIPDYIIACFFGREATPAVPVEGAGYQSQESAIDRIKATSNKMLLQSRKYIQKSQDLTKNFGADTQKYILIGSIILAIVFLYLIVGFILGQAQDVFSARRYADLITQAEISLAQATKNTANPDAFASHIAQAKEQISEVQSANKQEKQVNEILDRIAGLEKQASQISTISSDKIELMYEFPDTFEYVDMFVYDNQYYYVGARTLIGPHVFEQSPKVYQYPENTRVLFSDMRLDTGEVYLFSEEESVYEFSNGAFSSLNIDQVGGWKTASDINAYNGNIYLLSSDQKQIFKHTSSASGYSESIAMIDPAGISEDVTIRDFDIDGGVYVLRDNFELDRFITAPYEYQVDLMRDLGTNQPAGLTDTPTKIIANGQNSYVYVLAEGRIWIFQPNSRQYDAINGVTYIGQIEVAQLDIADMAIIRDGDNVQMLVTDGKSGVLRIRFGIVEGEIRMF